jgi:Reverse transcriptase (RNA-dependent DNA polymerase)
MGRGQGCQAVTVFTIKIKVANMRTDDQASLANHLDAAWTNLRKAGGDRDLPDVITLEDVAVEWPSFRDGIVSRVSTDRYSFSHVHVLDLPKDPLNVRPLAWLALEDRLIYDACVMAMMPIIDAVIPDNVYSYRWSKYKQALYSPISHWIAMQRRGRRYNRKNQQLLLLRTDVTSFYEYVDIETLLSDLGELKGIPNWSLSLLQTFLEQFNSSSHAWGIPQGADSSGILANLYLLPIDKYLRGHGFTYLRYSDDVMVFGPDWGRLRRALLDINHICRSRHLSLSAIKTRIVPADKVGLEFEDTSKDAVRYGIDIASPLAQDELRRYFDAVISREPPSERDLRFALNQLKRTYDDHAVSWLLQNMSELPQVARTAILYLTQFHDNRPEIDAELSAMLANKCFGLYPLVERQVISYFVRESVKKRKAADACWDILEDRDKGIEREFAARYIGRVSEPGDGARLREMFERESNEHVKRALLIAYYESGACPRTLLTTLAQRTAALGITARYLMLAPRDIPCPSLELIW